MGKVLQINIHSVSPLHIADASSGDAHIDSQGRIRSGKVPGTMPCTRIERRPVHSPKVVNGADTDKVESFPYIKANNIMGRLRRFALDVVSEVFMENGKTMSDKAYRGLSCGASSGAPTGVSPTLPDIRAARDNVYMGLFGGGDGMFESGVYFGDMNVRHLFMHGAGALSGSVDEASLSDVHPLLLTAPTSLVRRDAMLEMIDINIENVVTNGQKALDEWVELVGQKAPEGDEKESSAKPRREQLRNLVAYEVALAGLSYQGTVKMKPFTHDKHIGLLLECLLRLAKQNALGGKSSKGLGRFNMTVKEGDKTLLSVKDGDVMVVSDDAQAYLSEMENALDVLDVADVERFFQ
jgi:CRISPR type IV-associated protein Csf2